jgi:Tfp pilus assembly protein PilX
MDTWSSAMIVGLTILAVLTFIAISEVRKTHANGREQQ